MPRPPCRVAIIGPPQAGTSTLCQLLAQHHNALVLDMEVLVKPVLAKGKEEWLNKVKEETTQVAIEKIKMKIEQDGGQNSGKFFFFLPLQSARKAFKMPCSLKNVLYFLNM